MIMLNRLLKKAAPTGPSFARKPYRVGDQLAFYQRLRRALPSCTIFPKMPLSDLMSPLAHDARHLRQLQERLAGRRMAYAVFNDALELLCVVELTQPGLDDDERALTLALLEEARIACFSWEQGRLPTSEQILRAMAAFTDIAPPRYDAAANSVMRFDDEPLAGDTRTGTAQALTMDEVLKLTAQGHVKAVYPHIWERICLFHTEPAHLGNYLSTLSLQDRGSNRNGFPQGVIVELTNLQGANARFIRASAPVRKTWNDSFINR
jgi:hypothetical protein